MYIRIKEPVQLKHLNKDILNACEYLLNCDQTEIEVKLQISEPIINRSPYYNADNPKVKIVKKILTDKKYDLMFYILVFYIKDNRLEKFRHLFSFINENYDSVYIDNKLTQKIEDDVCLFRVIDREQFDCLMMLYSNKYQLLLDKPKIEITKEQVKQAIADTMIIVYKQLYGK